MRKLFVCGILIVLMGYCTVYTEAAEDKVPIVQSTQGIEVNNATSQKIVKSKNDKKPGKTKKKNRNKYLRYLKKTEKSKNKTRIKERDLEYLNNQLGIKKNKLEELNSKVKKGENQE